LAGSGKQSVPKSCRWLAGTLVAAALLGLVPALIVPASLVVLPAMIAATFLGVRVWRPPAGRPWHLLGVAAIAALVTALVGSGFPDGSVPAELAPLPQYLLAAAALISFDRARRGAVGRDGVADAAIVGVSAGLLAFALFVGPILGQDFTLVARITRALYPALDAVLVFLVARLGFGGAGRFSAFRLLVFGFVAALVADLAWAAFDAGLIGEPHGLDDIGYLLAYAAMGLAALSPSMAAFTAPAPSTVARWRTSRLIAIAGSLAVPAGLGVIVVPESTVERTVYICGGLALVALVCWRLATAVNQHAASEARLAHAASHDDLTDLPNRAHLAATIDAELARAAGTAGASGMAVVLLDLDRFKDLNDGWGHCVGDELLVTVAERLRTSIGHGGLVGRVSGDEFVVMCPDVPDLETAATVGLEILESFRPPFDLSVGDVIMSASVGVAYVDAGAPASAEQLIRDADTAMYRAKDLGRDRVAVFADAMLSTVRRRHAMEQALRRAIELDEITMHYQPVVDLETGRTVGFEALMRWFTNGTSVPPDEFIPIAEEIGLIVPLGARALSDAIRFLATCRDRTAGVELGMAVNISPRQLREPGLMETVRETLVASAIPPEALCLEITESTMLDGGPGVVDETLSSLRLLGVRVAADDFGTGYSALPYLKRFLVGRVKIDMTFVHGLGTSMHDEAIVSGILAIARSLGLEVIAEGVETPAQAERLRELGCGMAQGYLFAPPMPADAAAQYLLSSARMTI